MSDKKTKDELPLLYDGVLSKHIFRIASSDASGNSYMALTELAKYVNNVIAIDWNDVPIKSLDGTLLPNRVYKINPLTVPSPLTPDTFFTTYFDSIAGKSVMFPFGFSCSGGSPVMHVEVDWFNGGISIKRVHELVYDNDISGASNISLFPFTDANVQGNKVGSGFTLILSALDVSQQFKNNTCFGDGTFAPGTGTRHYLGIDFTKKCFKFKGLISQDSENVPTVDEIINELGETPSYARSDNGSYRMNVTLPIFTEGKTYVLIGHPLPEAAEAYITRFDDSRIDIKSYDVVFLAYADSLLQSIPFEIEVYF